MSLRTKQALILLLATVLPFAIGGAAVEFIVAPAYRRAVLRMYEEESRRLAEHVGWNLGRDLTRLEKLAAWSEVRLLVRQPPLSPQQTENLVGDWPHLSPSAPELQPLTDNRVARELRWWMETEADAAEIFATDAHGRVIACTGKPVEYAHLNRGWFQQAYNRGKGQVYVSDPVREPGSGVLSLDIAVPIYADGRAGSRAVGVMKMDQDLPTAFQDLKQAHIEGGQAFVADAEGRVIVSATSDPPVGRRLPPAAAALLRRSSDGSGTVSSNSDPELYAWSQVPLGPHGEPFDTPQRVIYVVTRRQLAEALGPLRSVQHWMIVISSTTILLAVGLGYWLADLLVVRQVRLLAKGMRRLSRGDFDGAGSIAAELTRVGKEES